MPEVGGDRAVAAHTIVTQAAQGAPLEIGRLHRRQQPLQERAQRLLLVARQRLDQLLTDRLGRLDVLPIQDLGIQRGFTSSFRRSTKPVARAIEDRGERWRPYRSIASWYLWRAADMTR